MFKKEQESERIEFSQKIEIAQKAFCQKANGRGRIILGGESNRFTFQSYIKNGFFEIAIDIPFKGQETLILPLNAPFKFSGSLYEKSLLEVSRAESKILKGFLFRTAKFVSLLNGHIESSQCKEGRCIDGVVNLEESGTSYEAPLSKLYVYSAQTKKAQNNYYSSLSFKTLSLEDVTKPLLALDLMVDACDIR